MAVIGYVDGSLSVVEIATGRQVNELMDLTDSTMACVRFRCGRLAALTFVDDGLGTDEKRLTLWKVTEFTILLHILTVSNLSFVFCVKKWND